ncbi:MAG: Transcriptional regulator, AcrR family, partial [uncultured Solirubrobacteraceae bacterium]
VNHRSPAAASRCPPQPREGPRGGGGRVCREWPRGAGRGHRAPRERRRGHRLPALSDEGGACRGAGRRALQQVGRDRRGGAAGAGRPVGGLRCSDLAVGERRRHRCRVVRDHGRSADRRAGGLVRADAPRGGDDDADRARAGGRGHARRCDRRRHQDDHVRLRTRRSGSARRQPDAVAALPRDRARRPADAV